jgi:hypothetical protein
MNAALDGAFLAELERICNKKQKHINIEITGE